MLFNPLSVFLTLAGLYMLIKLRFFFVFHPIRCIKKIKEGVREEEGFRSLTLALAGTLGIGNIFGVSLAIIIGGAGSVFWMLVSTLFASVIKYSEVMIANDEGDNKSPEKRGIFTSIKTKGGSLGPYLAIVYALVSLMLAFSMGAGLQIGAVKESFSELFNTPPILIGVFASVLILFSVLGGVERIEKVTAILIPVTTIIYIVMSLSCILINRERLLVALLSIIEGAFSTGGIFGGIFGFFFSRAVVIGYSRGILSNEAGTGTSSIAHSRSSQSDPATLGVMGIVEVFFDTVVLCTLTALVILSSPIDPLSYTSGMPLILDAVTLTLGKYSGAVLMLLVTSFAYATVICWYYYGSRCLEYLIGGSSERIFLFLYVLFSLVSPLINNALFVFSTDVFILIMSSITLFLIIKNSDRIKLLSESGGLTHPRKIKEILSRKERESR